jgi:putative nucleotidyltransferase with HDIG domain
MPDTASTQVDLQKIIGNISNLPTPPVVLQQINRVISDPNTSAYDIAAILSEDPAMSVKVLKLTNSAFYGLAKEVTSVKHAVVLIGINAVRSMVLSSAVLDMFKGDQKDAQFYDTFWRHSLATATCARHILRKMPEASMTDAEHGFSAGLLHDIGKLVMSCYLPDEFQKAETVADDRQVNSHIAERETLGYTHADIGSLLARKWKLPPMLCNAIDKHHTPEESGEEVFAYVTNFADYVAHLTFDPPGFQQRCEELVAPESFEILKIKRESLPTLKETLVGEYAKAETFMQIATTL